MTSPSNFKEYPHETALRLKHEAGPELYEALAAIMNAHASNVLFHNTALAERAQTALAKAENPS